MRSMKTNRTRIIASAALTAFLAGCGGTHSASTVPAVSPGAAQPAAGLASAVFRIQIPQRTTAGATRAPRYVSPATQSLAVLVTPSGAKPGPSQIFNLTTTSPNCTGAPLTCTITIDAAVGSDTFDFTAYDGTNATGNKLSHSTLTQTILAGTQNTVNAVLGGIVASLSFASTPWTTVFAEGSTATQTYTITAKDASGNTIIGAYDQPVAVKTFDPTTLGTSAAVTLSASQFTANGDTVTATYSGAPLPQGATLDFAVGPTVLTTATIAAFPPLLPTSFTPKSLDGQLGADGPLKLVAWYDAQDLSTMTLGPSNVVRLIKDKSGNATPHDLSASGNGGPTFNPTGGPGGRGVLDFVGGECLGPQLTGFPTNSDYTLLVMVQAHPNQVGAANVISGGFTGPGGHVFWFDDGMNHLTLGRAAGSLPSNVYTATVATAPPPGSFLAEGAYANAIHMGSVSQTLPGTAPAALADTSGGVIEIGGTASVGDVVKATINATTVTYTVTASDVAAANPAAAIASNFANALNASPAHTTINASVNTTIAAGQIFVTLTGGATVTTFSAGPTGGTGTTADVTVSDTSDPTFALNCYDSHPDSSKDNHIEEAAIYSGLLTATQRTQLRTYFNRKWAQGYIGTY
jgi:hypothetical protein